MAWWKNVFTAFVCVSVPFLALTLCNAQDDATLQESDDTLSIFESRINALIEENIMLKKSEYLALMQGESRRNQAILTF